MTFKDTYFIRLRDGNGSSVVAEVPLFKGLSADDVPEFESVLSAVCLRPEAWQECPFSAIRFGFSDAFHRLKDSGKDSDWEKGHCGIPINGLVWMGSAEVMAERMEEKLRQGFKVIKIKIGALNLRDEIRLISSLRSRFTPEQLEIRLDANGAFTPHNAPEILESLAQYHIHSIEQPIKAGNPQEMAGICAGSPIPIALDEELIGFRSPQQQEELLSIIKPQYIILKPSLCGGFEAADNYIRAAEKLGIGWWATSALESNIGLYAIGRWLAHKQFSLPQGLGTGALYSNNIASPLQMRDAALWYNPAVTWGSTDSLPWHS